MYGMLHYIGDERLAHSRWLDPPAASSGGRGAPWKSRRAKHAGATSSEGVRAAIAAVCRHPEDISDNIPSRFQI
jgi:hypothetical protein